MFPEASFAVIINGIDAGLPTVTVPKTAPAEFVIVTVATVLNDIETEFAVVAETVALVEPCAKRLPPPFSPLKAETETVSVPIGAITTVEQVVGQAIVVAVPPLMLTVADWVPDGPVMLTVRLAVVGGVGTTPPPPPDEPAGEAPPPPPPQLESSAANEARSSP